MNRLSKPITGLKPHYEVVVIGSGYGGGIAASRMARLKKKVCLLEKGKEFLPGEFPNTLVEAGKEMQIQNGKKTIGDSNGLYNFVMGDDINVFKGCGLGGTSLVNANVSIEAEERVFEDKWWPTELRKDMNTLKQGVQRAWEMLKPNPYPEGKNGYPVLPKTEGMRQSASEMKEKFRLLDINVTFEDTVNPMGVTQPKCTNCGDCVTGCNHGAKNTTAMNYLPDAVNHGAEIFTEAGVSYISRQDNHWLVFFKPYGTGREKFDAPDMFVTADNVFLSAGSLGSTEILLRSAKKGLDISDMIGKHFTGNGDVLGFGYNNDRRINGIGLGEKAKTGQIHDVGPCITSVIDLRHRDKLEDGMTLEEGSIPAPIKSVMLPALLPVSRLIGKDTDSGFVDFMNEKWREVKSVFGGVYRGAINHTQVYLVMSHDSGDGLMELDNDHLKIKWKGVGKEAIFKKVSENIRKATKALGGTYIKNPTWTRMLDYDLVTVHPLGGCIMGDDAATGVTDHKGQVFKGKSGKSLHPGLYVMDGAIIPRPVGTNPLLTISGLAERNCKLIADELKETLDYGFGAIPKKYIQDIKPGVQFTETMRGYFSLNEKEDFKKGLDLGKKEDSPFEFTLTIRSDDSEKFLKEPDHLAAMSGTVTSPKLSASPMTISQGKFNLFISDPAAPSNKKMLYEAQLHSIEGKSWFFHGYKEIKNDKGLDVWMDTTTLFITIYDGHDATSKVVGKGKMIIEPKDFLNQLTTMKAINLAKGENGMSIIASFGKYFAGNVWDTFVKGGLK